MTLAKRDTSQRTCPECGADNLELTDDPMAVEYRGDTYVIEPGFSYLRCRRCGEELVAGEHLDALLRQTSDEARATRGMLASAEIRQLRFDLGLTQAAFERVLGVAAGTVIRWERGTVVQNATADTLMRVLRSHPDLVGELADPLLVAREGRGPYRTRG